MKVLVAYMSKTGNTRKVAEAIFESIQDEKTIKPIDAVDSLEGFDIAFLGFPVHMLGPDKTTVKLLEKHCNNGRNIALFITHASPEDSPDLPPMLEKFRLAARGANLVGMFDCQGELAKTVKFIMSVYPNAKFRSWAKHDNSQGQPDQTRINQARTFSENIMQKLHETSFDSKSPSAEDSVVEKNKELAKTEPVPAEAKCLEPEQTRSVMKIEYFHASKYGNGARVAEEFKKQMAARGVTVNVHHIRDSRANEIPPANLYLFSSPGRMGKPLGDMVRFMKDTNLPTGTRYAVLTTEIAPKPDKKTGKVPSEEEQDKWQRVIPTMNEILQGKGLVKVSQGKVLVTGLKGPLEEGWQQKVESFASWIPILSGASQEENPRQLVGMTA